MKESANAIRTVGLTKYYGDIPGVVDLDLNVKSGEIFGFLGPNGAGKTTTIRMLMDFIRPTDGMVEIFGMDAHQDALALRHMVGNLPGEFAFYPQQTGWEFLQIWGSLHGATRDRSEMLADRLDVDLSRKLGELSHGNKQKVGLIQAMMGNPAFLILDEPAYGLDPLVQQTLYEILLELKNSGTTVFLSSHNLSEVQHVCDRVAVIREGKLIALDSVSNLRHQVVRTMQVTFYEEVDPAPLLGKGVQLAEHGGRSVVLLVESDVGDLISRLAKMPVEDIVFPEPTVEDIFHAIYKGESS